MITMTYQGIGTYGFYIAITIFMIGIQAFLFQSFIFPQGRKNNGGNLIMILISQELILLSVGILLINLSVGLDDLVGANLTLYQLPLAGCESAVAQALLVSYYPQRGTISLRLYSLNMFPHSNPKS